MNQMAEQFAAAQHARDVLSIAAAADVPDSAWTNDERIQRACTTLGLEPEEAQDLAEDLVDMQEAESGV